MVESNCGVGEPAFGQIKDMEAGSSGEDFCRKFSQRNYHLQSSAV